MIGPSVLIDRAPPDSRGRGQRWTGYAIKYEGDRMKKYM